MSSHTLLERLSHVYHAQGLNGVLLGVYRRVARPTARPFTALRERVAGTCGFEIGGPSRVFALGGLLPIYPLAQRIDNCNYAATTLWEADAGDGNDFRFAADRRAGRQWVAEATNLAGVADGGYDFVLSSHALEHLANPLKALAEWRRILKPGGTLVLVVPHKDGTFDHRRPVTSMDHLLDDYRADRGEDDLTHLPEVLALHDASRDPTVHALSLKERMQRNHEFRSMHHHVFDAKLAVAVVEWADFSVRAVEAVRPDHIIVIACNEGSRAPWSGRIRSPFPSDAARWVKRYAY